MLLPRGSDCSDHHALIGPERVDSLNLINNPWYLKCNTTSPIVQALEEIQADIKSVQNLFQQSSRDLKLRGIMYVGTVQNIAKVGQVTCTL